MASATTASWQASKDAGNKAYKSGDLEGAAAKYGEALQDPSISGKDRSTVLANRAQVNIKLEKFADAVEDCTACLQLAPDNIKAMFRRGTAYESLGQTSEAVADFVAVLERDPTVVGARVALKRLDPSKLPAEPQAPSRVGDGARASSGSGADAPKLTQEDMKHLADTEGRLRHVQRQLQQTRSRQMQAHRSGMAFGSQIKAVGELPAETPLYRKLGRVFVRADRPKLETFLQEKQGEAERRTKAAAAAVGHLTKQEAEARSALTEVYRTVLKMDAGQAAKGGAPTS